VADASKTVVHLGEQLDDARLAAEFGGISGQTMDLIAYEQTAAVEAFADVRFAGQSHELSVRVFRPMWEHIREQFLTAYRERYGPPPAGRKIEIVTLRARRIGHVPEMKLPGLHFTPDGAPIECGLVEPDVESTNAKAFTRSVLLSAGRTGGPVLIIDPEATCFIPRGWFVEAFENGSVVAEQKD
jgi:N-methylhydantoinase A/oxoprolinase/acetone carboxylase beta subunit